MPTEEIPVYPIFLTQIQGALTVVVGGGGVAQRKVQGLLAVGAVVRVISPDVTGDLRQWSQLGRIQWVERTYKRGDLVGAFLAFAATDQRDVNGQVAQEADELGVLCNVADATREGSFHVPAIHRESGLVIAVGSGGVSPGRSRQVRDWIARRLEELGDG